MSQSMEMSRICGSRPPQSGRQTSSCTTGIINSILDLFDQLSKSWNLGMQPLLTNWAKLY